MELRLSRRLPLSMQLVGIDGGATHVRAVEVTTVQAAGHVRPRAGQRIAKARHSSSVPGFETPAERGLNERRRTRGRDSGGAEQGWAWVELDRPLPGRDRARTRGGTCARRHRISRA